MTFRMPRMVSMLRNELDAIAFVRIYRHGEAWLLYYTETMQRSYQHSCDYIIRANGCYWWEDLTSQGGRRSKGVCLVSIEGYLVAPPGTVLPTLCRSPWTVSHQPSSIIHSKVLIRCKSLPLSYAYTYFDATNSPTINISRHRKQHQRVCGCTARSSSKQQPPEASFSFYAPAFTSSLFLSTVVL